MINKEVFYNQEKDVYYALEPNLEHYVEHPDTTQDVALLWVVKYDENKNPSSIHSEDKFDVVDVCYVVKEQGDGFTNKEIIYYSDLQPQYQIDDVNSLELVGEFIGHEDFYYAADVHHNAIKDPQAFIDTIEFRLDWNMLVTKEEVAMYEKLIEKSKENNSPVFDEER